MEAEWWRECNGNFLPSTAHEHRNRRWCLERRISGSRWDTHDEARYWDLKCVCPTLCNPIDCSPPSSSVHGIFQAKILDWVATSYPRGSSQPWNWSISCTGRLILYHWTTREALWYMRGTPKLIIQGHLGTGSVKWKQMKHLLWLYGKRILWAVLGPNSQGRDYLLKRQNWAIKGLKVSQSVTPKRPRTRQSTRHWGSPRRITNHSSDGESRVLAARRRWAQLQSTWHRNRSFRNRPLVACKLPHQKPNLHEINSTFLF